LFSDLRRLTLYSLIALVSSVLIFQVPAEVSAHPSTFSASVEPGETITDSSTQFTVTVNVLPDSSHDIGSIEILMSPLDDDNWGFPTNIVISGFPGASKWKVDSIDEGVLKIKGKGSDSNDLQLGQTMNIDLSVNTPSSAGVSTWTIKASGDRGFGNGHQTMTEISIDVLTSSEDSDNDDNSSDDSDDGNSSLTVSVQTAKNTGTATLSVDETSGCGISEVDSINEANLGTDTTPPVQFPHGLLEFTTLCVAPGATVTITMIFPSEIPIDSEYWKIVNDEWFKLPNDLVGDNDGDNVLTITLTDGGTGDADGVANGQIVDPGGPGVPINSNSSGSSCDGKIIITNDLTIIGKCVIHDLHPPKLTKVFVTAGDFLCLEGIDDTGLAAVMVNGIKIPTWPGSINSFCAKDIVQEGEMIEIVATDYAGNNSTAIVVNKEVIKPAQTSKFLTYVDKDLNPHTGIEAIVIENKGNEPLRQVRVTLSPNMDRGVFLLSEYAFKEIVDREIVTITMNTKYDNKEYEGYVTVAAANGGILGIFPVDIKSDDFHIRPALEDTTHPTVYLDITTIGSEVPEPKPDTQEIHEQKEKQMQFFFKFKNMSSLQYKKWLTEQ
jgi:hypothetical protein